MSPFPGSSGGPVKPLDAPESGPPDRTHGPVVQGGSGRRAEHGHEVRGLAAHEAREEARGDFLGGAGREAAPDVDARAGGKAGEHLERTLLRLHGGAVEEMEGDDEPALQDQERGQLGRGRRERGPAGR